MLPPVPDPCLVSRDTVNNKLTITTTHFSIYGIQAVASDATVIPAAGVARALEPLGDNLERVWHLDDTTREWTFYDPRPVFAESNTVKELVPGEAYSIRVSAYQTMTLNGQVHRLYAGWNLIGW